MALDRMDRLNAEQPIKAVWTIRGDTEQLLINMSNIIARQKRFRVINNNKFLYNFSIMEHFIALNGVSCHKESLTEIHKYILK